MTNQIMYYSASINGFYSYGADPNQLPRDAMEISYVEYVEIIIAASQAGKCLQPDAKGYPYVADCLPQPIDDDAASKNSPETEAKKLLDETDWYVMRAMDTGDKIPSDVKKERENARKILNKSKEK